ncbi:non-canonical purine NTP diphosphatase [Salinimicrobium oceani]|uniref:dITP/XTP pyrophosphatase n=1 Tax=Salinimicrobium oceani TaxID=2722702 RepID=A0ABX1CWT4_9FLAO|nr:non-canonical purine NTP diphosphatase [Salinimicrobium oceani]NJW52745.1 non-canonical purine NTP diphosphatase [Salinimicrobium oceani]
MKIVFATNNKNKIKEVQALLPNDIELLSLEEIGCHEDIPETSPTIEGNAIQKTEYVKKNYGYDCFADDTGLEVKALDGAPGVYSARYAGEAKDSNANIEKLLRELQEKENRSARFKTVIALQLNDSLHTFTGICSGNIIFERKGAAGFGYDPVFQPEGKSLTFAEMSLEEKSEISHRARATRNLIDFLQDYSGKR